MQKHSMLKHLVDGEKMTVIANCTSKSHTKNVYLRLQVFHVNTLLQYLLHLLDGIREAVLTQQTVEYLDSLTMPRAILLLLLL